MMLQLLSAILMVALVTEARGQDQASSPFLLRMTIAPSGPVWVGQRVAVTLTAMTPVRFAGPLAWPDLTAAQGRIIVLPEASTVPGTERVNGVSYAAIQRTYSLVPAVAGDLAIAPVSMAVRVGGPDGGTLEASSTTTARALTARLPPGVTDVARLVVASRFRMTATVEGNDGEVHVGDAILRTLHMEAEDTAAMLLPPGQWTAPNGVRVYPDPPVVQDRSDRGTLHALRSERVTFVPEQPGRVELPGFSVTWFDPGSGRSRQVSVDPLVLNVLPAAGGGAVQTPSPRGAWLWLVGFVGVLLGLGPMLWWLRGVRGARSAQPMSALRQACRAGDPKAALVALYRWCDEVLPPGGERTIAELARKAGEPALSQQARLLEVRVFAGDATPWNGRALLDAVRSAERPMRGRVTSARSVGLPALNPIGAAHARPRLAEPRWAR